MLSHLSCIVQKKYFFNRIKKFEFFVFEYFLNIICFIAYLVAATTLLETYQEFDFSCILSFFVFLLQTYYNIYLKHIPFFIIIIIIFFKIILGIYHKPFFGASLFSLYNIVYFSLGTFLCLFNYISVSQL